MEGKKRVLYCITKSAWGGAQRYVHDLATSLDRNRFEAVVAAGGNGPLFDILQKSGIRTIRIPYAERDIRFWKEPLLFLALFKIYWRERPDVVHLNSSKIGGVGALAAINYRIITRRTLSIIFTVHGWGMLEDRPRWQQYLIRFASQTASWFHDAVILISRRDYDLAVKFIPKRKLVFIPHGIAPIAFKTREEARDELSHQSAALFSEKIFAIGTIAELTPNKGLRYLVDAAEKIEKGNGKKCLFFIMGVGEEEDELKNLIREKGLHETVILLGHIPEAARFLKAFDLFLLPSIKEGLPYVILEAMQAGLPIAATYVGGIPDLIENGVHGLLTSPHDGIALRNAISTILNMTPEKRMRLGIEAHERVATKFSYSAMIQRTEKLYARP